MLVGWTAVQMFSSLLVDVSIMGRGLRSSVAPNQFGQFVGFHTATRGNLHSKEAEFGT